MSDGGAPGPVTEVDVTLEVNGQAQRLRVGTSEMLVDTIRRRLGLTGTRVGCDQNSCGACTVLVGDDPVASCSTFAWQAERAPITTIEGLGPDGLSAEQEAFASTSSFQCGYCTPGLILSTAALLDAHPDPDRATIVEWLGANICRCTGYLMVIEAVEDAARRRAEALP